MNHSFFSLCRLFIIVSSIALFSACSTNDDTIPYPDVLVTSIYPEAAGGGDTIKIYGENLPVNKYAIKASLNGEKVEIISSCPDSLLAVIPEMAGSGDLTIEVKGKSYTKPFTYNYVATVTTVAGSGVSGRDDGAGDAASFNCPWGITVDSADGTLYVADMYNRLIRKITMPGKVVSTIPISYDVDFSSPYNIALDQHSKQLYLTDFADHVIRVEPDGTNRLVYQGQHALAGIALGPDHHLYLGNNIEGTITRVDTAGNNATQFVSGLNVPRNILFDVSGTMWVSAYPHARITPDGQVTTLPIDPEYTGYEIAVDRRGNVYETSSFNNIIRMIEKSTGRMLTLAGSGNAEDADGVGTGASFNGPQGMVIDRHGHLYVTTYNHSTAGGNKIRKIVVR